jgi:HEAT repeat protein
MSKDSVRPLIHALRSRDEPTRYQAAKGLGHLGGDAAEAVPELVRGLSDESSRVVSAAHDTLRMIGPAAIPHLLKIMRDPDEEEEVRGDAADSLANLGTAALPHILCALEDDDDVVRLAAVDAVPSLGVAAEAAIPRLATLLQHPSLSRPAAIALAATAASSPNPQQTLAFRELLTALKAGNVALRRDVVDSFAFMGDAVNLAIPPLKQACQDSDPVVREKATNLLKKLSTSGPEER